MVFNNGERSYRSEIGISQLCSNVVFQATVSMLCIELA